MNPKRLTQEGFTLVEMAVVLAIIGLLLGALLMPLSAQMDQKRTGETQQTLAQIQDAILGFAVANGRLPCPASAASNGLESFCSNATGGCGAVIVPPTPMPAHGRCSNPYNGFVPAATLGISPIDPTGYALDAWQLSPQNRIRYAVSNHYDGGNLLYTFTAASGIKTTTMPVLAALGAAEYLSVCATTTGITPTTCGGAQILTSNAIAVIYSVGKNGATGGAGADETANPNPNSANNDQVFVSHPYEPPSAPNGEFDDLMVWISPNTLYNRMIAAGILP